MTDTPLVLVDVDGVLNVYTLTSKQRSRLWYHQGWRNTWATLDGRRFRLFASPAHARWLTGLAAETGAELAWASTWEHSANQYVSPLIGLPQLPVAPAPFGDKAPSVVPWTAGRPWVWFDDDAIELGEADRLAKLAGQPHLCVKVDPYVGITEADVDRARDWLRRLAGETEPPADHSWFWQS